MMETKLWAALCALLLVNLGSAEHANESHIAPSNASKSAAGEVATEAPAAVPASSLDPNGSAVTSPSPTTSLRVTSSLSSNTTAEGHNIPLTPEQKKDNGSSIITPSEATTPEKHLTQPPSPPSGSHTPTTHMDLTSSTTRTTHTSHIVPVDTTSSTTTSSTTTSSTTTFSITQSNQSTHNKTNLFTSVTTPELANQDTTTTTTTTIIQSSTTSSTRSSQEPTGSVSQTHTSPQNTIQTDAHSKTSTVVHQKPTTPPSSSPSVQPKAHADTSSQLKVGGDTTMVHESPTLDPLLAGLVSAFIITAVIITLLLFLKLRRRDNRPEFRRLQDLPMDDMEDTPLSMYSY